MFYELNKGVLIIRFLKKGLCLSALFLLITSCGLDVSKESDVVELEIISEMIRKIDPAFHKRDPECLEWKMTKGDVLLSFSKMRKATPVEWGAWCSVYSCFYIGKARYHGRIYDIEVNAASFISLTEEDGEHTMYFIEENPSRLFIVPCNCCEVSEPISKVSVPSPSVQRTGGTSVCPLNSGMNQLIKRYIEKVYCET